jgi:hypothetical protein
MYAHPDIISQIRSQRERERLATAEQQRLTRQLRAESRASRRTSRAEHPLRRALRTAVRLRPALAHDTATGQPPAG